jgi:hypothetical protein
VSGRGWGVGTGEVGAEGGLHGCWVGRAGAVPAQFTVPCLGRPYGPKWWPRHGTKNGPCPALALKGPCRAVPVPCFLVPCQCRPVVLVPFGQLYDQLTTPDLSFYY